jgi:hypothetical protein
VSWGPLLVNLAVTAGLAALRGWRGGRRTRASPHGRDNTTASQSMIAREGCV